MDQPHVDPRRIKADHEYPVPRSEADRLADAALGIGPDGQDLPEPPDPLGGYSEPDAAAQRRRRLTAALASGTTVQDCMSARRKRKFLSRLAEGWTVGASAASAGWTRGMAYLAREADPEFKALWDEAIELGTDALEDEAMIRAVHGREKPVFQNGVHVGDVVERSDGLLTLLLKARRREKFGDQSKVEHDVKGGVLVIPPSAPQTQDAWEAAAAEGQARHRSNQGDEE